VVTLSSSNTKEALELLSLSPARGLPSRLSEGDAQEPLSSYDSNLFKDWPKANNVAVRFYVVLTTEALSSHASTTDASCGRQKSHAGSLVTQQPRSRAACCKGPIGGNLKTLMRRI
jgi:hypothetical protein